MNGVRIAVARTIRNRWPVLENKHSPGAIELLSDEGKRAAFVEAVESHPKFAKWEELKKEREDLEEEEFQLSKTYATHRRFVRAFENVALAANLGKVADREASERYERLVKAERGTLGE